ncbi:glyoxylase-like metal-dependent hydrolase (beta-lactamase superfamily II) [Tenacibaculum adriaticum]|uniref:Glyoxylase-like metal-dependent hydrolase (Beta-lactamase superfamily II) n=1 Tax=Tenacibaculum adriaticum TaxID=413713 RepID=A0A5S5DSW8_9FLAO|nr:MBL fold metallo-hydrolase [Tenacibaculum adriaticum]TYP98991.1 glyoxylase-like metal-dependent hydrolase (beta-lactamase superfamily II) [Tenacibaculum adriaticum]
MKVQQLYTKCLAEATYYIVSKGETAIIDPLREINPYLEMIAKDNAKLKYIFLTHFHADFVSGHVDLARETGATIVYGPTAKAAFKFYEGKDNEIFKLGDVSIKLLHTPGHTLESSSYLLFDSLGKAHCLFSGDTLFIGDVGRPDLAVSTTITKEDLAEKLYSSLQNKIMTLPDDIIIYPNHGKGSACGKNMSKETYDTLGNQKKVNYALDANLTKDGFVKRVLEGLTSPPQYFPKNAQMNKLINKDINQVITDGLCPISVTECIDYLINDSALILDVRSAEEYTKKHILNSIFIGLEGDFAPWVGTLIKNINQPIILIAPKDKELEAITRLSRIGYDNVLGYVSGGIDEWETRGIITNTVTCVDAFSKELSNSISFLDVRKHAEYNDNNVKNAKHIPLDILHQETTKLDREQKYYVYCAGGYRSVIAISILTRLGFTNLVNINGGFTQIIKNNIPLTKCKKNCGACACSH